jgi:hypothetical protein
MEILPALITNIESLIALEKQHPDLLYTPLYEFIIKWLDFSADRKTAELKELHTILVDGQDCDHMGTPWEKEWLETGRVCKCPACEIARKCISLIDGLDM